LAERKRIFGFLIAALAVLCGLMALVAWMPLAGARAKWRSGNGDQAIRQAEEWSRLRLWPNQYQQLLAAARLTAGRRAEARRNLDALRGACLWISVVDKHEVAHRLFARGAYDDFLAYDAASHERSDAEPVKIDRAAALAATGRIAEAETALRSVAAKPAALERAIAQRKRGRWPYVVDRSGAPIADLVLATGDVATVNRDFEALVEKEAGTLTIEANARRIGLSDTIELTLDPRIQRAAMQALGGSRGSLVAIDPATNEVLAIASNGGRNLALEQQYEPGSVMKILTAGTGATVPFPYACKGALPIDGRSFGDWREGGHGVLPDFEEALAESCNVVFADIGLRAGREQLMALHKRAGFDSQARLGLFDVPLGRTVGRIFNNFETAYYAIGLEHETTTAFHLAMLASMMANRGALTTPRLLRARRSILGEAVSGAPKEAAVQVMPRETAERIIRAMQAVVLRPEGTGRRARVDGMSLALKTGTAGQRAQGFDSVIVAFAPVDDPKIAFALVAEGAGPAEFTAAKIAHDFVIGIDAFRLH
jgi:penicillin-binding protein A